jgi:hypothetical protein
MAIRRFQSDPHHVGPLSLRVRGAVDDSDLGEDDEIVGYLPEEPIGPFTIEFTHAPPPGTCSDPNCIAIEKNHGDDHVYGAPAMPFGPGGIYLCMDFGFMDRTIMQVVEIASDRAYARAPRTTGEDGRPVIDVEAVPRDKKALPPKP